jgi:hypothetical protein
MADKILVDTTKPKGVPEIMHKMRVLCLISRIARPGHEGATAVARLATKRQSTVAINNLSKLVDNPLGAVPLSLQLFPAR